MRAAATVCFCVVFSSVCTSPGRQAHSQVHWCVSCCIVLVHQTCKARHEQAASSWKLPRLVARRRRDNVPPLLQTCCCASPLNHPRPLPAKAKPQTDSALSCRRCRDPWSRRSWPTRRACRRRGCTPSSRADPCAVSAAVVGHQCSVKTPHGGGLAGTSSGAPCPRAAAAVLSSLAQLTAGQHTEGESAGRRLYARVRSTRVFSSVVVGPTWRRGRGPRC